MQKARFKMLRTVALMLALCCILSISGCAAKKTEELHTESVEDAKTTEELYAESVEDAKTTEELYTESVEDAKHAEENEILPLVTLTPDSDMVTWNDDGTKVLLLSWHEHPDRYIAGKSITCKDGDIWTFTDKEILSWYDENSKDVKDWNLRLKQLIGLPTSAEYTHVSAFWVDIEEVIRPAYQIDVTKQMSAKLLDGSGLGAYKPWFDDNAEYSYSEDTPYPWTGLGYTYDWAEDDNEYGLSEFLVLADSEIEVEWTKTTDEFIDWMEKN